MIYYEQGKVSMAGKETLCWSCKNACGRCPWSDKSFTPVKGWKAKQVPYNIGKKKSFTYIVRSCPLYKTQKYVRVGLNDLVTLLGVSVKTLTRWSNEDIKKLAKMKGVDLIINTDTKNRLFYIAE